jgi:hypothetical protein
MHACITIGDGESGLSVRHAGRCAGLQDASAEDPGAENSGIQPYVSSSIGRVAVSKTAGWGFESLLTCDVR